MRTASWSMSSALAGAVVVLALCLFAPVSGAAPPPARPAELPEPNIPDWLDLPGQGDFQLPPLRPPPTVPPWSPPSPPTAPWSPPPPPTAPWPPPPPTISTPPETGTTGPSPTETTTGTDGAGSQYRASTPTPRPAGTPAGGTATTRPQDPPLTGPPGPGSSTTDDRPIPIPIPIPIPNTEEDGTPGSEPSHVALIAAAGLTSVAAAVGAGFMARARQARRWLDEHVDTRPRQGPPAVAVDPPPGQVRGRSVRLEPRADAGHQIIEENGRDQN